MEYLLEKLCIITLSGLIIYGLAYLCRLYANNYIKKNREDLSERLNPLSSECKVECFDLLRKESCFDFYISKLKLNYKYCCSRSIVSNASNNEIKYLLKYSNIDNNEDALEMIDFCENWLTAYDDTMRKMDEFNKEILDIVPTFIKLFATRKIVSFFVCDISVALAKKGNPEFCFSYTSPAGKSEKNHSISITPELLKKVESEIYRHISKKDHSKKQRAAMTQDLREAIKKRDNYTCCKCGNSVFKEPNLLLEVDHIIPVSKGGLTVESNLQTLCWRCNREKADSI